jgi:hypothetical protein
MKKFLVGLAAAAALAIPVVAATPGIASADVSNNKTVSDAHGYATANAIHNFIQPAGGNGLGSYRSAETGQEVSALGGHRGEVAHPDWIDTQGSPTTPGVFAPISNNG